MEIIKVDFVKKNGVITCSSHLLKMIREKFSIKNPSYQMRKFVPRLYAITPVGAFQVGLWFEIENYIRTLNLAIKIQITPEFQKNYKPNLNIKTASTIEGFDYYDYQQDTLKEFLQHGRGIGILATGAGKCFGKGTQLLMFDGSIRKVEDIIQGDLLMGPDSTPRRVISLARGTDRLYRISSVGQKDGIDEYVVNSSHILSFKITSLGTSKWKTKKGYNTKEKHGYVNGQKVKSGDIVNISVEDYLKLPKYQKHILKSWKPTIIRWKQEDINDDQIEKLIPAYFLGIWLGDGSSATPSVTTMDDEIVKYINSVSEEYNLRIRTSSKLNNRAKTYHLTTGREGENKYHDRNSILNSLKQLSLIKNKHIPEVYLFSSESNRLELLAGILDTDGHLQRNKKGNIKGFELTLKQKGFMESVVFLCKSLGFSANMKKCVKSSQTGKTGEYYRVHINGDLQKIPCKILRKNTQNYTPFYNPCLKGIKVEEVGQGEYYGFEVEGRDRLFLLKDFTVTHNSLIQAGLCKTLIDNKPDCKILMVVPNVSLLNQLYLSFIHEYGIPQTTMWGDGKIPDLKQNILIANSQILTSDVKATLKIVENYDYVIVDEVHTINNKKNKISKVIHNINTPFKFGLTATLPDDIMASWNVVGKIGPILYEKNSYELRKQQTISDVEVKVLVCEHSPKPVFPKGQNPTDAYEAEFNYVINCVERNDIIKKIAEKLEGNIIIVVDRRDYIDSLEKILKNTTKKLCIITGDTPTEERTSIQDSMEKESGIICLVMSKCFSTGISIKNLHYAILCYMGKGGVKTVQTVGRTVRKHHSKDKAVIFDISDNLQYSLSHLRKRLEIYKKQKIDYSLKKIKL